jgi:hypothetical protein
MIAVDDPTIWRYLTPEKFSSTLEYSAIYFSAADKLGDPYEGSTSELEFEKRQDQSLGVHAASATTNEDFMRLCVMVNCWFQAERESKAMWDLYGGSPNAICIKSRLGRLKSECGGGTRVFYLEKSTRKEVNCEGNIPEILVKDIWYYDPHGNILDTRTDLKYWQGKYTRKADWFQQESEVRALFWYDRIYDKDLEIPQPHLTDLGQSRNRSHSRFVSKRRKARLFDGLYLEVALSSLIEEIVLAPNASHRRQREIEELISKRDLETSVRYSKIAIAPRF